MIKMMSEDVRTFSTIENFILRIQTFSTIFDPLPCIPLLIGVRGMMIGGGSMLIGVRGIC